MDTSGHPHTPDYIVETFKEELIKIEAEWGVTVSSIVTDNASNMASFRRLVKNPSELMHSYTCQTHHMNLFAKEFSAKLMNPIDRFLHVLNYLPLHDAGSAPLRQNNVPRPPLPTETHWNSVCDTLQFFVEHWSNLVVVGNTITGPSDQIYRSMEDIQLKWTAADLLEIFKPLGKALDEVQSDTCFIGERYQIWYNLRIKTQEQFTEISCDRYEKAVNENLLIQRMCQMLSITSKISMSK